MDTAPASRANRSLGAMAAMAFAGAVAVSALATFGGEQQQDQVGTYWIVVLFLAGITALVFGLVVRSGMRTAGAANSAALSGLVTSIAAVVTIVAYWSGLPVLLGVAGTLLGMRARENAEQGGGRRGMATAAVALGLIAAAGAAVIVVMDTLASRA